MNRWHRLLALVVVWGGISFGGLVLAGTPFGGDDAGFIPSTSAIGKCEDGLTKNVAKLFQAIVTCHIKTGQAQFKGKAFDEEGCESTDLGKFAGTIAKLKGCPSCAAANGSVLPGLVEGIIDTLNGHIACDGTVPFGDGDDTGFVPTTKPIAKCESSVGKNVGKLVKGLLTCHVKTADAGLKGKPFDDETCETTAISKFNAANTKLTGCPACLSSGFGSFATIIEPFVDGTNGDLYCSPSGAFVDRPVE